MGHGVKIDQNRSYDTWESLGRCLESLKSSEFETVASGETLSTDAPDLTRFPSVPLNPAVMTAPQPTKRGSIRMVTPHDMSLSPTILSDLDRGTSPDPIRQSLKYDAENYDPVATTRPGQGQRERHDDHRQISPDRRSFFTKHNSYIQKRAKIKSGRFFAADSSEVSSQMQASEPHNAVEGTAKPRIKAHPVDLLRTETQRSIECSSKYSNDELDPTDTERSLTKIHNGPESLRYGQTNSSMAESHRYDSAGSLPQSCKSQDAPSILEVRGRNGRWTWYRKVPNAGYDNSEETANHARDEDPRLEDLRVTGAMSRRPSQHRRHSNLQPIRSPLGPVSNGTFRLIDSKGKRPVSVGSPQAGKGKFGSQRGEFGAFL